MIAILVFTILVAFFSQLALNEPHPDDRLLCGIIAGISAIALIATLVGSL